MAPNNLKLECVETVTRLMWETDGRLHKLEMSHPDALKLAKLMKRSVKAATPPPPPLPPPLTSLRWCLHRGFSGENPRVLQQLCANPETGAEEWCDVPTWVEGASHGV